MLVLDDCLPDGLGSELHAQLREQGVESPCIMLTGRPKVSTAVTLTRNGLFDYLTKPVDLRCFRESLRRAVMHSAASSPDTDEFGLVEVSPGMKEVGRLMQQAAAHPHMTVLLTGETGVGKDVVARAIHRWTFQKLETAPPLIVLNCSTLPAEMFEAELFGAQSGAYTGALRDRVGLAEAADGGTWFLDEIGEVPLPFQAKLLQFLETREYRRLGNSKLFTFEGRIIAATNRPLEEEVRQQRFRADLWYRLNVFNITLPPLRERREDLEGLATAVLGVLARKYQRPAPLLKPADLDILRTYAFPGNVRELRNVLERALVQTSAAAQWLDIDAAWLRQARSNGESVPLPAQTSPLTSAPPRTLSPLEAQEYSLIRRTLADERGFIRRAAARLGMSHQALLRRLQKWPELRAN